MSHVISPEDRRLIERVRMANKILSIFVFALQEGSVPKSERLGISDMLSAVAEEIREQESQQASSGPLHESVPELL